MKKMIKTLIILLGLTSVFTACQDIEDTYDRGDGEIRYIGVCNNLTVTPGWERLILKWENNVDPIINQIKLKWSNDDKADSIFLPRGTAEYSIPNLGNNTYKIELCAVDKDGNTSLSNTIYGRPYTNEHEEIKSFTRVIAKQYFLKNHLIMLFSGWQDGIESAILKYTKINGQEGEFSLTSDIAKEMLYVLPDEIDESKPITLYRTGRLSNSPDKIQFAPYILEDTKTYTADFKDFIKTKFGEGSKEMDANGIITDNWSNSVESFELDASVSSFEDFLNFPKLKKIILGKNRYQTELGAADETRGQYQLFEPEISKKVLDILHQFNGLTIERYNKHFSELQGISYLKEMGNSTLPNYSYYDMTSASISMTPEDDNDYNSNLKYLLDNNANSCWTPLTTASMTTYQINIDLKKEVNASGIKIVQKSFEEYAQDKSIAPTSIKAEYAGNDGFYHQATHVETNYIGNSSGETILLPFAEGQQKLRYIRISVPSQYYHGFYQVTLAEIGLYK